MAVGAMVISSYMVITALKWPLKTALFPVAIGIPVFFLALSESVLSLWGKEEDAEKSKMGLGSSQGKEEALPARKIIVGFLFGVGFFGLILLFSFPIAIPLFVFLYMKVYGKERWGLSLILTASAWASFYGLFVKALHTPFGKGLFQMALKSLGILGSYKTF